MGKVLDWLVLGQAQDWCNFQNWQNRQNRQNKQLGSLTDKAFQQAKSQRELHHLVGGKNIICQQGSLLAEQQLVSQKSCSFHLQFIRHHEIKPQTQSARGGKYASLAAQEDITVQEQHSRAYNFDLGWCQYIGSYRADRFSNASSHRWKLWLQRL